MDAWLRDFTLILKQFPFSFFSISRRLARNFSFPHNSSPEVGVYGFGA